MDGCWKSSPWWGMYCEASRIIAGSGDARSLRRAAKLIRRLHILAGFSREAICGLNEAARLAHPAETTAAAICRFVSDEGIAELAEMAEARDERARIEAGIARPNPRTGYHVECIDVDF